MLVGVAYCDNPDTAAAGRYVASEAIRKAGRGDQCGLVLLFATARHDEQILRGAVESVVGPVPIIGGGAIGAIVNDSFGYAGDQVIAACMWLDGARCDILAEGGLRESEEETGKRLGQRLKLLDVTPESPVTLFYDSFDHTGGGVRMLMATRLLAGIERGLGFLPDLTGAGMMGDYVNTRTRQYIGGGLGEHYAVALAFSGDIRVDSVIMHGCHPGTKYYTVTKADNQHILEINGRPALEFIAGLLGPDIPPENYPFFLIFGVNCGDKWGPFDEENYASRMCLAIDRERGAITMFEPDMVEGTEFQIMYCNMDPVKPRIDGLFDGLGDREPVFAMYINCAGRAAGYGGMDLEDAAMVQASVGGRAPLFGIYSGVEIASVNGRPRGLDWTGVFCLFSTSKKQKGRDGI